MTQVAILQRPWRDPVAALLADPKDRAENLMIVDLMRNDLSRVCRPGSVRTPELFRLESFANVHHLVSTVTGRLMDGAGPAQLLQAAFPPGSITGAPKVQAMKLISQLEPPRGPYCGSLFWAGFDGSMDSSVLIRTVACVQDMDGWRYEAGAVLDDRDHEPVHISHAGLPLPGPRTAGPAAIRQREATNLSSGRLFCPEGGLEVGEIVVGHLRRQVLALDLLAFGELALQAKDEGEVLAHLQASAGGGDGLAQQGFGLGLVALGGVEHGGV